jgi:hypothetical protein
MGGDAGEHVCKPNLRINAVHLCGNDETIHRRRTLAAAIGPAPGNSTRAAFGGIVREADAPVLEE